jgi:hypothetical protein
MHCQYAEFRYTECFFTECCDECHHYAVILNVVATLWSILKTTGFGGKKTVWLHNCHSLFQLEQEMAEVKKDVNKQVSILLNLFFCQ